nr:FIST C-terminal domain-containing protein [Gemmatimonadaceae bacterium]
TNDVHALLEGLRERCPSKQLIGCTSAGEFVSGAAGEGASCAVALRSSTMSFRAVIARGVHGDPAGVAERLVTGFAGLGNGGRRHHAALVLTDALAGFADELVTELTTYTAGRYQFFGGGAGDDAKFTQTHVFCGADIATDAVVALEILSDKPLGVGVRHGWEPAGSPLRVTEVAGATLLSLNAAPAIQAFEEHAAATGQSFDRKDPMPFFLHNVLGVASPEGYTLRVPLAIGDDGSVTCAAEIPAGAIVHFMRATAASSAEAASAATLDALRQLEGNKPQVALFFDCVATRLRMGRDFDLELDALQESLGSASFAGCNTYGQVARADGQFSGFHNCTAVVCVIPE